MKYESAESTTTSVIICMEATAAMAKLWKQDSRVYLDPLLAAIEGGQLGKCRLAVVIFGAPLPYRWVPICITELRSHASAQCVLMYTEL